jgi:hypothetical protein
MMALALVSPAPARAQIPVADATAYAQLVQQLTALNNQLTQLQQIYATATTTLGTLSGARGMDSIAATLNSLRTPVPDSYGTHMASPNLLGVYSDISSGLASTVRSNFQITSYPGDAFYQSEVVRHGDRSAAETAAAQAIFDTVASRRTTLDTLRSQLAAAGDATAAAQLNARISYEMSQGVNDLSQGIAMLLLQHSNKALDQQRALEQENVSRATALGALRGN